MLGGGFLGLFLIFDDFDQEFIDGNRHVIYPWNQSKIQNLKSSRPRSYPWGQSKIQNLKSKI